MQLTQTSVLSTEHETQLGSGQMTHNPSGDIVKVVLRQVPHVKLLSHVMQLGSLHMKHCPELRVTSTTVPF